MVMHLQALEKTTVWRNHIRRGLAAILFALVIMTLGGLNASPASAETPKTLTEEQRSYYDSDDYYFDYDEYKVPDGNQCPGAIEVRASLTLPIYSVRQEFTPAGFVQAEQAFGGNVVAYCTYEGPNVSATLIVTEYTDATVRWRNLNQQDMTCYVSCDGLLESDPNSTGDSFAMYYAMNGWWTRDVTHNATGTKPMGMSFMARSMLRWSPELPGTHICTVYVSTPGVTTLAGVETIDRGTQGLSQQACSDAIHRDWPDYEQDPYLPQFPAD